MFRFPPTLKRALPALRRLARDRRGAAAVMLAIALSGIIGFAGLGTEVAAWYYTTRAMQGAADAAASSAAGELAAGKITGSTVSGDQLTHTGRAVSATFNFTNGVSNTTVSVNNPPANTANLADCSAPFASKNCYVEVVIQQPQTPLLSALFMSTGPTITARAVALANTSVTPDGCLVALDSHQGDTGISASGSPTITLNNCSLIDNSNLSAGGTITALSAYVSGSISGSGLSTTQGTYTGVNPYPGPYINLATPSYTHGHCDEGNANNGKKITGNKTQVYTPSPLSTPFVFCGGLEIQGGSTAVLCPGTYIFDQGTLALRGGGVLLAPPTASTTPTLSSACPGNTNNGVTIFLTNSASTTGPPATISIGANSISTFTAPTSGTYAGISIFQDRMTCASHNCGDTMIGGATQNLTGVMYFPNNILSYNGNASSGGPVCTKLIAYQISFSGNPNFNSNCTSTGVQQISYTNGTLVM